MERVYRPLESEDDIFHRIIIALERLERFLNSERGLSGSELKLTAVGTERDLHDDVKNVPTRETYFYEILLQCLCLSIAAVPYEDGDVFETAVESFMTDLLEWYAGRELLEHYDEVDASVIPIVLVLTDQINGNNPDEMLRKYFYNIPLADRSNEEKCRIIKTEVEGWFDVRWLWRPTPIHLDKSGDITSHRRGNAVDGYKRVLLALIILFDTSEPAKMLYSIVKNYLPQIAQQVPNFNEEAIERAYEMRAHIR